MTKDNEVMTFPEVVRYKPETAEPVLGGYEAFKASQADMPGWVQKLFESGREGFAAQGVPTPKLERWKYTNLLPQIKPFGAELGASDVVYNDPVNLVEKIGDVCINGAPEWVEEIFSSVPAGAEQYGDMALWHLCNAYFRDGLIIDVPPGQIVDKPVEITIRGHDVWFFVPRTAFRLGEGAELTIIEYHTGAGHYWNNRVTQIIVGKNAKLNHIRVQENSPQAVYTQNTHIQIDRDATYEHVSLTTGAGISRNQVHAELQGENGTCNLYALNMIKGAQLADMTVTVEHKAPHCNSNQFVRSLIDDQAKGVFQGKVHVHQAAQQTDGYQLSNAILLSEGAEMDTKPELEIYADDVKCSHGATTSQLDEEPLFYIRSRGVPADEAKALLLGSFMREVIEKMDYEPMRETLNERVAQWLQTLKS